MAVHDCNTAHCPHPIRRRCGTSLPEVLVALVVLATTAAWSLMAAAGAQRAIGASERHRSALRRAELALAGLDGLPCDSAVAVAPVREGRWVVVTSRVRTGDVVRSAAEVRAAAGDTVRVARAAWCR